MGGEAVGGQRWRRQRLAQTRDPVIGVAQGDDGLLQLAEDSRRLGVQRKAVPPDMGSHQPVLAQYTLPAGG